MRYITCLIFLLSASLAWSGERPNIIFVMADDLGWRDVGFNGAEFFETPHLDTLRKGGMNFTDAYPGASNCMPSRACIMTGTYIPRTQMWTPGGGAKGRSAYMKFLVPQRYTNKGKDAFPSKTILPGSFTSIAEVLKPAGYTSGHLGKWHLGPDPQGFDLSDSSGKGTPITKTFYGNIDVAETLTDASLKFIEANREKPFFLYLCHYDVHTPIRARAAVVEKYKKKLASKEWSRQWNTTYAAMVEAVDTSVGRIQAKLKELKLEERTLFIFTSDNGGFAGATTNEPLKAAKGAFYEGGIRVPLVMTWPGVIEAGSTCATPVTGVDYLPTFAALARAELPEKQPVDGVSVVPLLKGKTLPERSIFWHYPLYLSGSGYNKPINICGTVTPYWRTTPCSVIRQGDYKLIEFFEDSRTELYNLKLDMGEQQDLAKKEPEKAAALLAELKAWQKKTEAVIPDKPNPDFNPKAPVKKRKKK